VIQARRPAHGLRHRATEKLAGEQDLHPGSIPYMDRLDSVDDVQRATRTVSHREAARPAVSADPRQLHPREVPRRSEPAETTLSVAGRARVSMRRDEHLHLTASATREDM